MISNGLCWGHPANDKHEHCNPWAYPIVEKISDGSHNGCHMAELTALYGMPRESVHGMPHGLPEHMMRTLAFCGTCRMLHPDCAMVRICQNVRGHLQVVIEGNVFLLSICNS